MLSTYVSKLPLHIYSDKKTNRKRGLTKAYIGLKGILGLDRRRPNSEYEVKKGGDVNSFRIVISFDVCLWN